MEKTFGDSGKIKALSLEAGRTTNSSIMKTLLIIIVTLVVSQQIYRSYGPRNIITKTTDTCLGSVRWSLRSAEHLLK
jgi:ribosomal protein S8E